MRGQCSIQLCFQLVKIQHCVHAFRLHCHLNVSNFGLNYARRESEVSELREAKQVDVFRLNYGVTERNFPQNPARDIHMLDGNSKYGKSLQQHTEFVPSNGSQVETTVYSNCLISQPDLPTFENMNNHLFSCIIYNWTVWPQTFKINTKFTIKKIQ